MFYTRIPVSTNLPHSERLLNKSRKYFPSIGLIVGGIGAAVFWLASVILPISIAVLLSMAATVLVTGAFHEDGFADSCDGLGGGWSKQQVLKIMKDSRIGTYGSIGLILMLGLKFLSLWELAQANAMLLFWILLFSHTFSRFCASSIMDLFDYVQDNDVSKIKPIASSRLNRKEQLISLSITTVPTIALVVQRAGGLFALIAALLVSYCFAKYCQVRIGGFTGDTLGAVQQLSELAIYISLLAII